MRRRSSSSRPGRDTVVLLDGNVLVALLFDLHTHHDQAQSWFAQNVHRFATCPITQGSLLRLCMILGMVQSFDDALSGMRALTTHPGHQFWPDDLSYHDVPSFGLQGHRQITDAYHASLARHHGGRLATFDRGLAALHADVAELIT